jgi:hypothetical protein
MPSLSQADDAEQELPVPSSFFASLLADAPAQQPTNTPLGTPPPESADPPPLVLCPTLTPALPQPPPPPQQAAAPSMPSLPGSTSSAEASPGSGSQQQGKARLLQQRWLPWTSPRLGREGRAESSSLASPSPRADSLADSGEGGDSRARAGGGKRSKEEVQKRNKEVRAAGAHLQYEHADERPFRCPGLAGEDTRKDCCVKEAENNPICAMHAGAAALQGPAEGALAGWAVRAVWNETSPECCALLATAMRLGLPLCAHAGQGEGAGGQGG